MTRSRMRCGSPPGTAAPSPSGRHEHSVLASLPRWDALNYRIQWEIRSKEEKLQGPLDLIFG